MKYQGKESIDYPGDWIAGVIADSPEGDGPIYLAISLVHSRKSVPSNMRIGTTHQ